MTDPIKIEPIQCGDLLLWPARKTCTFQGGDEIKFSEREFHLLVVFAMNAETNISRAALVDAVWQGLECTSNVIDVYVGYLRAKLPAGVRIATERRVGYRLTFQPAPPKAAVPVEGNAS